MESQPAVTRVTSNGSGNNELELLRERDYPFYKPAAGVGGNTASSSGQSTTQNGSGNTATNGEQTGGSNSSSSHAHAVIGHEVITNKEPSTIQAPTASERERAGYFGNSNTSSSNKGTASAGTFRHSNSYAAGYTRPPYSIDASTAGIPTPSTSFGYSPAPPTANTTDSSEAADSDVGDYEELVQDNQQQHLHAPIQPAAAASPGESGSFQ